MPGINSPERTYKSPGKCIYCGRDDTELTDEHIVPFGLGGKLVLEQASCKACAKVTGKVEGARLRAMFAPLRSRAGLPSRRPKDRAREEPLFIITATVVSSKNQSPCSNILPHFV